MLNRYPLFMTVIATVIAVSSLAMAADEKKGEKKEEKKKKPKPTVAIMEKDVDADFAIQGEYSGTIQTEDGEAKLGVQVIADGGGKFRGFGYPGGLPGDGWNGKVKMKGQGETKDGVTILYSKEGNNGEIRDGVMTLKNKEGDVVGSLKKIVRKSPTLGAKPPEGAVVLFDGSSTDHFKNGKLSEDGYLMQGTTSKDKFGSFTLHIEFKLSYMPFARGQGRSNSGCYMQGRYEVQMLDSFGLEGKNNECGGIYSIKDTDLNMCFPPLSWQTYDVEFTAAKFENGKKVEHAKMTVRHNGVVIHKDVELPKSTTAAPVKEGPEPGPIYLQNHGNQLRYRNIWVVSKS